MPSARCSTFDWAEAAGSPDSSEAAAQATAHVLMAAQALFGAHLCRGSALADRRVLHAEAASALTAALAELRR